MANSWECARPLLKRAQTPQSKEEAAVACAPVQMTAVSFFPPSPSVAGVRNPDISAAF